MQNLWDYIHLGGGGGGQQSTQSHRNLQEGLFQIASSTCGILVQVNNTNNISYGPNATNVQYNNFGTSTTSTNPAAAAGSSGAGTSSSTTYATSSQSYTAHRGHGAASTSGTASGVAKASSLLEQEQSVVLLPADNSHGPPHQQRTKTFFSHYKHRLSTVLEGNTAAGPPGDDDFDLWDRGQMLRSEQGSPHQFGHGPWCKPSCIPITVILILIILVVLLPLLDHTNDRPGAHTLPNSTSLLCTDPCRISLVESIPDGLVFVDNAPLFPSTYDTWLDLIDMANVSIELGTFYWTLRSSNVLNHSSAWQGDAIYQKLISTKLQRPQVTINIAQSVPTRDAPNTDTELLAKRGIANVRSVNMPRLMNGGGVLHTKLWIIDRKHFYVGSANMDWRSLTQVKEMGVVVRDCACLAADVAKIFDVYWMLGNDSARIPDKWPKSVHTQINMNKTALVNFNNGTSEFATYFSSSPPPLSPPDRTQDIDAIVDIIMRAEKFVHIAVMDYFPLRIYTPKVKYWSDIDTAIRTAAIDHRVSVKMLISFWNHSRSSEDYFLRSLTSLTGSYGGVDVQVRRFVVPATTDQARIPFGRVNHNKYMVTEQVAYIGTSNWSGDYFVDTAGVGLVMRDHKAERDRNETTVRSDLAAVFERDWNSQYAKLL